MKNGRSDILLPLAAAFVCLLLTWQAHAALWNPDYLPGWDGSGYVLRGVRVHDALVAGDAEKLGELLLRPDIRPPLFPLLLGLFCLFAGTDITVGTTWAQLSFALSLAALPWIGRRIGAESGRARAGLYAGAGAAVLTATGLDHLALIMTPMSESTTLLCTLLCTAVILRAAQRPGPWAALAVGLALLTAALVRYNLPVMMGVPLVAWRIWEEIRTPATEEAPAGARLRGAAWMALWFLPTVATFGLWSVLRPNLGEQIGKFLVNRSSGLAFWSAENLLFFPLALRDSYLGLPGWAVLALFFAGLAALLPRRSLEIAPGWARGWSLRVESSPGLRLLQLQGLAAIAALTLHDYKIERNLYASLPLIYLCALLPLRIARTDALQEDRPALSPPGWLAAALLLILAGWQIATGVPTLPDRYHMEGDPGIRAALDAIARLAPRQPRLWITGTNDSLSPPLIELWLRAHADPEPRLITRSEAQAERTRTGIDPAWNDRYQQVVEEEFLSDREISRTTYICIETLPGSRRFRAGQRWTNYQNNYARAFSQQEKIPLLERLTLPEAGIQLSAYAADAPQRPRADAPQRPAPQRPAADLPLPDAPFYDDNFDQGGEGWGLFPPGEIPPEGIGRQGMFRVTLVLPTRLQLCGPVIPLPDGLTALTARWEISAGRMEGRAPVLQLRESDPSGAVLKRPDGTARIHRSGPVRPDGAQVLGGPITLEAGVSHVKPCVILEGVSGEFTLDRLTLAAAP